VNTRSLDQSNGVPDSEDEAGVAAADVHGVYCERMARQILAGLSADALAQLMQAKRDGTLDALLAEAVRRARIQAGAVRELNALVVELVEPVTSISFPRHRTRSGRGARDDF
jgi:hypothetical protein